MANLALTTVCNLDCAFCFAGAKGAAQRSMLVSGYKAALDFLARSGIDQVRLLGGEPTLHPQFAEFVMWALDRGFRVLVFTNGLMPDAVLRCLESRPEGSVTLLVHARPRSLCIGGEWLRREKALRRLGRRAMLGFNIDSPAFKPDFLLKLIELCGLQRTVRLGLAHPSADGTNHFLHPRQYPRVGARLGEFIRNCRTAGVHVDYDCGFVPCMFPEGGLKEVDVADLGRRCNPVLDLLPSGEVISCFPLSGLKRAVLTSEQDAASLRSEFCNAFKGFRHAGIYRKCAACGFRSRNECFGGCLATTLQRRRMSGTRAIA